MNGNKILTELLEKSEYGSKEQAIASLTYFTNPETIKDLNNSHIFKIIRNPAKRGEMTDEYMFDNNFCVQDIFRWVNKLNKKELKDVQFNHIYSDRKSIEKYTCLSNIVLTPAFLAKLTDTDNDIKYLLKYRAYEIYNYNPEKIDFVKPINYDKIEWKDYRPIIVNLKEHMKHIAEKNKKNKAILSINKFGWFFNNFEPLIE
jgi:hypothetical protein